MQMTITYASYDDDHDGFVHTNALRDMNYESCIMRGGESHGNADCVALRCGRLMVEIRGWAIIYWKRWVFRSRESASCSMKRAYAMWMGGRSGEGTSVRAHAYGDPRIMLIMDEWTSSPWQSRLFAAFCGRPDRAFPLHIMCSSALSSRPTYDVPSVFKPQINHGARHTILLGNYIYFRVNAKVFREHIVCAGRI